MPIVNKSGLKQVIRAGRDLFESPYHLKSFLREAWEPTTPVAARIMHEVPDEPVVPIRLIEDQPDGVQKIIDYFAHRRSRCNLDKGTGASLGLL